MATYIRPQIAESTTKTRPGTMIALDYWLMKLRVEGRRCRVQGLGFRV